MDENVDKKLELFQKEIMGRVAEERRKADQEVNLYQAEEMAKYEDAALQEAFAMIRLEAARREQNINKKVAAKAEENRRSLFKRRDDYTSEVFAQARANLTAFAAVDKTTGKPTQAYQSFLVKAAAKLGEEAGASNAGETILLVRTEDLHMAKEIQEAFAKPCRVEASDRILIGGLAAKDSASGTFEDRSLESRLEEQKAWFRGNSGMIINL